jgi:hypothetical protein
VLVLACTVGVWILAGGVGSPALRGDDARRGEVDRDLQHERHELPAAELVAAIDELPAIRTQVIVQASVADETDNLDPVDPVQPDSTSVDDRVFPVYTFWDDSGGPPMLDDELTLTLVERADGAPFEPWSTMVSLGAVRLMQPTHSVAMPLPASGLYRATCKDHRYKPTDVWVPNVDQPRVAIVLESANPADAGR